jgi:hypothetical protein
MAAQRTVSNLSAMPPGAASPTTTTPYSTIAADLGGCGGWRGGAGSRDEAALASQGRSHRFDSCHAHSAFLQVRPDLRTWLRASDACGQVAGQQTGSNRERTGGQTVHYRRSRSGAVAVPTCRNLNCPRGVLAGALLAPIGPSSMGDAAARSRPVPGQSRGLAASLVSNHVSIWGFRSRPVADALRRSGPPRPGTGSAGRARQGRSLRPRRTAT